MMNNVKISIINNWVKIIFVIVLLIILTVFIYSIFIYKYDILKHYNKLYAKEELANISNLLNQSQSKILNVYEYIDKKNGNIITVIGEEKLIESNTTYSFKNIGGDDISSDIQKINNHKIIYNDKSIIGVYVYRPVNHNQDKNGINYIIATSHPIDYQEDEYKHQISSSVIVKSPNNLEIIDFINTYNKNYVLYTETLPVKNRELIGRKKLMISEIKYIDNTLKAINEKEINIPNHLHMFEIRIIKEESGYTLIYRIRINKERGKIDIILSKMDKNFDIYYSTNIPIILPEGVYNKLCVSKVDREYIPEYIGNYALAFSYVNFSNEDSSNIIVFFDSEGNLNNTPYLKIDPNKPDEYRAEDVDLINHNGAFYIFYKYMETGYYITAITPEGERIFTPSLLYEDGIKDSGLSLFEYDDSIICWNGNNLKEYIILKTSQEKKLIDKNHKFLSDRITLNESDYGDIFIKDDNLFIFWAMNDNTTYSTVLDFNSIFNN